MANRPIWNIRRRHEWLATPLKGKRVKQRSRSRIGLESALARKKKEKQPEAQQQEPSSAAQN